MRDVRSPDARRIVRILGVCFCASGAASLLYQMVWMRLVLARFGVTSAIVATVLTVFMLGLALGTALAGRWTARRDRLTLYALAEGVTALGGVAVPWGLALGRAGLLAAGDLVSPWYTALSAAAISVTLLPFCVAMGVTFPAAMAFLQRTTPQASALFSPLYLANVVGAVAGVLGTAFVLIEWLGFRATSGVGIALNLVAGGLALTVRRAGAPPAAVPAAPPARSAAVSSTRLAALFLTGCGTMAMEVVWMRLYTPFVWTYVYSFAEILATYLVATALGTWAYRAGWPQRWWPTPWHAWSWLCLGAVLPLVAASMRWSLPVAWRVIGGLAPLSFVLGVLTPWLVDEAAGGRAQAASRAYAVNLLGCVIGPLIAGFLLLPHLGTRWSLACAMLPWFLWLWHPAVRRAVAPWLVVTVSIVALLAWRSTVMWDDLFPRAQVRHDHTATVIATGEGRWRRLFINGVSTTFLTPITKLMVHWPLALREELPPRRLEGLIIGLGMGTSVRALLAWDAAVTAVELVPSVAEFLDFFAPEVAVRVQARDPLARVVIDDGRRWLDRSDQRYDVIIIDPPPPIETSGSGLLYSVEFYRSAKRRLRPDGVLQTWLPHDEPETTAAVTLALRRSFTHLRVFHAVGTSWGHHFIASDRPLRRGGADELLRRLPPAALQDLTEWDTLSAQEYFQRLLTQEVDPRTLLLPRTPGGGTALTDDRPINEFFFLRRTARSWRRWWQRRSVGAVE